MHALSYPDFLSVFHHMLKILLTDWFIQLLCGSYDNWEQFTGAASQLLNIFQ